MKRSTGMFLLVSMFVTLTSLFGVAPQIAQAAQSVLILADNSSPAFNGAAHVSDLIAAFTNTGAAITTNSTELTNGSAMPLSLVSGWDVVIVVTVTGTEIDASDVPALQGAVNTRASRAFLFFTDACNGCTRGSANAVLPIVNAVGGWSATLGGPDDSAYVASLIGAYSAFSSLPTVASMAYSPLLGVPPANVIYTTNAPISPGPCAVVAPATGTSACVFMSTDVTEFWASGIIGITQAQANGLALAYLNAVLDCPLIPTAVGGTPSASVAALSLGYPNPFSVGTAIDLTLRHDAAVKVEVFDAAGHRVRAIDLDRVGAGTSRLNFDGRDDGGRPLVSGVYFYRVHASGETITRKIVIAR